MADQGNLFVIAAPSGTGKTTLVKSLVETLPNVMVSISHTTRKKIYDEIEGINYHFIEPSEFRQMIAQDKFLEYAIIFDHYYGTSKDWVIKTLAQGIDVILEIDWQGEQQIKKILPDTISIFILPPSLKDLQTRLMTRNQDPSEVIIKRLADAQETISHLYEFDFLIINDIFDQALHQLSTIIEANRLRQKCQIKKYADLIAHLSHQSE